jgi:hypothetical protein
MVPHTVGPDDEKRNEGMKSSLKERKKERQSTCTGKTFGSVSKMWFERAIVLNQHPPMHHPLDDRHY